MRNLLYGVALALGFTATGALACDCGAPQPTPERAMRSASVVAEGVVVASGPGRLTLEVQRWYKGQPASRLEVGTGADDCGYDFGVGERLLVYVRARGGRLEVVQCRDDVRVTWGDAARRESAALAASHEQC